MNTAAAPAPEEKAGGGGGRNTKPPNLHRPEPWYPLGVLSASVTPDGLVLFRLICTKVPSEEILAELASMKISLVVKA